MIENPEFRFQHTAVCYHLASYKEIGLEKAARPEDKDSCDMFWSVEKDLLRDEFRETAPFYSRHVNIDPWEVQIHFPDQVEYVSEGRRMTSECAGSDRLRPAKAFLRYTVFRNSGIRIWHLIFQTPAGSYFTEYDLIKLISLYAGIQEKTKSALQGQIRVSYGKSERQPLLNLIKAMVGQEVASDLSIKGGTVHATLKGAGDTAIDWDKLSVLINELNRSGVDSAAYQKLEELYKSPAHERALNVLTGILLGIFDFKRMFFTEVTDTLTPTVRMGDELIRLINGTLTILVSEPAEAGVFYSLGITPYMLIPHSVLIHNTMQVNRALEDLSKILRVNSSTMQDLERARLDAEPRLNRDFVPQVFRYRTERAILETAFEETGASDKFAMAQSMLGEVVKRIEAIKREHERRFMWGIGFASAFFAGFGFHPIADQFFKEVCIRHYRWEWISFAVFLVCALVALIALVRVRPRKGK